MPTMKDIADMLRQGANRAEELRDTPGYEQDFKCCELEQEADYMRLLASEVEQMQCKTCEAFIPPQKGLLGPWRQCIKVNVSNQGPNFGCWNWQEKEVKNG